MNIDDIISKAIIEFRNKGCSPDEAQRQAYLLFYRLYRDAEAQTIIENTIQKKEDK